MYVLYRGEVSGGDGVEILTRFLPLLSYSFLTPGHLFPDFHLQLPNLAGGGPVFYLQIKKSCIIFWKCWSFQQFSNYEIWNMCMPTSSLIFLPWCLCHSWNRTLQQCLLNVMCYYSFLKTFGRSHTAFSCAIKLQPMKRWPCEPQIRHLRNASSVILSKYERGKPLISFH